MSIEILQGDCVESLNKLEDQSINTCLLHSLALG